MDCTELIIDQKSRFKKTEVHIKFGIMTTQQHGDLLKPNGLLISAAENLGFVHCISSVSSFISGIWGRTWEGETSCGNLAPFTTKKISTA